MAGGHQFFYVVATLNPKKVSIINFIKCVKLLIGIPKALSALVGSGLVKKRRLLGEGHPVDPAKSILEADQWPLSEIVAGQRGAGGSLFATL